MLYNLPTSLLILNQKAWFVFQNQNNNILSKKEIINLKKINNDISINEIIKIYLPLSKLLNLHICSNLQKRKIVQKFLNINQSKNIPYIIGISGSVASGKSTTAKILQILLRRWPEHRIVELVTTDGFLYSNQILKKKNLMQKKGFPQSYNIHHLLDFIMQIKSGTQSMKIPIYSHITYDIVHRCQQVVYVPNILILEGLNVLHTHYNFSKLFSHYFISDFIDFSIYIDAPEILLQEWYIRRFLKFCYTTFSYPESYFYRYTRLPKNVLIAIASSQWRHINQLNLRNHILPTKKYANLILNKGINHTINSILLKNPTSPYKHTSI